MKASYIIHSRICNLFLDHAWQKKVQVSACADFARDELFPELLEALKIIMKNCFVLFAALQTLPNQ